MARIPLVPEIGIAFQREDRIERDASARVHFPNKNGYRWFGSLNWTPIHLLRGSVALEISLKGWYVYRDRVRGSRRMQGLMEISLLVPITELSFAGSTGALTGAEAPK